MKKLALVVVFFALCACEPTPSPSPAVCPSPSPSAISTAERIQACVDREIQLYGDLCAESSVGYETMDGRHAYFEGVKCGSIGVAGCIGRTR